MVCLVALVHHVIQVNADRGESPRAPNTSSARNARDKEALAFLVSSDRDLLKRGFPSSIMEIQSKKSQLIHVTFSVVA